MKTQPKNMHQLFDKLNDLKAVFIYGKKIIPVIQSLIDFMSETVPLLENINQSIEQTANQIPNAQDQLTDVTNATELATTQILDRIDEITGDLVVVNKGTKELLEISIERDNKIDSLIKKHPELNDELNELKFNGTKKSLKKHMETLDKINDNTYKITLSLQVQDITSQQLSAVNHLIKTVQHRLSGLIEDIDESDIEQLDQNLNPEATFDADASFMRDANKQDMADEMFNSPAPAEKTSQDEIDKLFSSKS